MQLAIWAEIVRARARAGPRARPRADQEWLELKVWPSVARRETRYGGSVWSWELKFGVPRVGARGQTMNLLVHLVCSYYGTRPRARMHAYIRPDRELHTHAIGRPSTDPVDLFECMYLARSRTPKSGPAIMALLLPGGTGQGLGGRFRWGQRVLRARIEVC